MEEDDLDDDFFGRCFIPFGFIFFLTETLDEDGETGACDDVGGAGTLGLTGEVEACRYICSPATELPETQHSWDLFVEAERAFLGTDTPIISSAAFHGGAGRKTFAGGKLFLGW